MSEELITVKPFAFYVLEEEPVTVINEPPIGAYNPVLQIWVYGQETGMSPRNSDCGDSVTQTGGYVTQYIPKNGGWDTSMDFSDGD